MPAVIEIREKGLHLWRQLLREGDSRVRTKEGVTDSARPAIRRSKEAEKITKKEPSLTKMLSWGQT